MSVILKQVQHDTLLAKFSSMPEGLDESKNFMNPGQPETPENIGNFLAAQKAKDAGALRTQPAANNSFRPYTEEGMTNEDTGLPANDEESPPTGYQETAPAEPAQEIDVAAAMARDVAQKRAAAKKIAGQRSAIDKQLAELEKQLENIRRPKGGFTSFLKLNPFDMLDLAMPSLNAKINSAYNSVKGARGEAKILAIGSAVAALKILKAALIVARLVASVIDAIFKWFSLCLKTRYFGPFFFVPLIILIILIPILLPFFAIMYAAFEFGSLTSEVKATRKKINQTLDKLEKELANEKKKMNLRKQRQDLAAQEQNLQH